MVVAESVHTSLSDGKLTFIGHTDSRGDASSNKKLSLNRATTVKDWFESWSSENSVDGWAFSVDGKGDSTLKVADVDVEGNFREEAGRVNRRVEIEIKVKE